MTYLEFCSPLFAEWYEWKREVMSISQSTEVKVVLGIHTRWHVDVELKHLEKLSFQLIPGINAMKQHQQHALCNFAFQCFISTNCGISHSVQGNQSLCVDQKKSSMFVYTITPWRRQLESLYFIWAYFFYQHSPLVTLIHSVQHFKVCY